jgi:hypothetical protein
MVKGDHVPIGGDRPDGEPEMWQVPEQHRRPVDTREDQHDQSQEENVMNITERG